MRPRTPMRFLVAILAGVCVLAIEQTIFRPVVQHYSQHDAADWERAADIALQNAVRRLGSGIDADDVRVCEFEVADGARLRFVLALPTAAVDDGCLVIAWYRVEANRAGAILWMSPIDWSGGAAPPGSSAAPRESGSSPLSLSGA